MSQPRLSVEGVARDAKVFAVSNQRSFHNARSNRSFLDTREITRQCTSHQSHGIPSSQYPAANFHCGRSGDQAWLTFHKVPMRIVDLLHVRNKLPLAPRIRTSTNHVCHCHSRKNVLSEAAGPVHVLNHIRDSLSHCRRCSRAA